MCQEPTYDDVYNTAIVYLAMRDHATTEIRRKLLRKDYPDILVEEVITELLARQYLDDTRFAQTQAQVLIRKLWGPQQISAKLRHRGISKDILHLVMQHLNNTTDWAELCHKRFVKHIGRKQREALSDKEIQRAYRHLIYRGFWAETVRDVIFNR